VIDIRAKSEEALKGVCDVCFDLLGRHAIVKRRNDDDRHVNLGEEIDRHTHSIDHPHK
jgi:hypothetical protein